MCVSRRTRTDTGFINALQCAIELHVGQANRHPQVPCGERGSHFFRMAPSRPSGEWPAEIAGRVRPATGPLAGLGRYLVGCRPAPSGIAGPHCLERRHSPAGQYFRGWEVAEASQGNRSQAKWIHEPRRDLPRPRFRDGFGCTGEIAQSSQSLTNARVGPLRSVGQRVNEHENGTDLGRFSWSRQRCHSSALSPQSLAPRGPARSGCCPAMLAGVPATQRRRPDRCGPTRSSSQRFEIPNPLFRLGIRSTWERLRSRRHPSSPGQRRPTGVVFVVGLLRSVGAFVVQHSQQRMHDIVRRRSGRRQRHDDQIAPCLSG